jgi:hypothetical protein
MCHATTPASHSTPCACVPAAAMVFTLESRIHKPFHPPPCALPPPSSHPLPLPPYSGPVALFVAPEVLPDFAGCQLLPPTAVTGAAAVVVGDMGSAWSYDTLNRAFRLMMDSPAPQLLSLGKSR